ncbi:MAG TPA: hypothetical protein VGM37_02215 [Armatimonadota bacterium]|jgi:hypothetical protein
MKNEGVARDERTVSVENASYRLAYLFLSFGLLAIIAYRSYALRESCWDLFALVIAGGLVAQLYQASHRVLTRRWAATAALTLLAAAVVGAGIALNLKR